MKKITYFLAIAVLSLMTVACSKQNAVEDVDLSISKLNQFNSTFEKFNQDGVIDGINPTKNKEENKDSEYRQLKKLAEEYYELINRINSNIKKDKERISKGKKSNGYEEKYIQAIESKKDEIAKATDLFIKNLNILNDYYNGNEIITEEVEELEEVTEDITEEIEANSDEIN